MDYLACELLRDSDVPLYEQLYDYIKGEITVGRLREGDKLPSKRKLATLLKISQNTIQTAYEQLEAEGYIEVQARRGYFILPLTDLEYIESKMKNESSTVGVYPKEQTAIYDFHPSQIDTVHFPFDKWRKYVKQHIEPVHQSSLLLGENQGELDLRQEIAQYLYHSRGVTCKPEQIVIGAGVEVLLQQLIFLFDKNTVYGVEDPGYHLMMKILHNYGYEVYPLLVDRQGVDIHAIKKSPIDILYTTPSHHFPYGTVLPIQRRQQLLNWAAEKNDRYIIEDDYDSEFRYNGKTIPSLQSMDRGEKVIYLGSFSKSFIPSLRISYMVLPKPLVKSYKEKLSFYHCTVSRIDQNALSGFMKDGEFEKHLNRMKKVYRRKVEIVLNVLKSFPQLEVMGESSGLHVVLIVKNGMNESELVARAKRERLKIYPLSNYSIIRREDKEPQIILGFAGIREEQLKHSLKALFKAWGMDDID
ncbi:PLP-dependent aminotransferase family protein [Cytobacillus sp. FSL R7-0696]|uniref:MocR-like pyridoxine biosynthesis transcription factor PdxR n=1 Tax=Cytobacillus sp. FSL R7-0696 TaxID=2921691 RepID=UPI0030F73770